MPFRFNSLPSDMCLEIIEKFDLMDFVAFQLSSHNAKAVSQNVKTTHTLRTNVCEISAVSGKIRLIVRDGKRQLINREMEELPAMRFSCEEIYVRSEFNNQMCQSIIECFQKGGLKGESLDFFDSEISCSPESFHEFLNFTRVTHVSSISRWRPELLRNMPSTVDSVRVMSALKDTDLDFIHASRIEIEDALVTSAGLNAVLMEWFVGKRNITRIAITAWNHLAAKTVLHGIDC